MRGNPEEQHALDADGEELARLGHRAVEIEARDAGHRRDRARIAGAFHDEERLHELLDRGRDAREPARVRPRCGAGVADAARSVSGSRRHGGAGGLQARRKLRAQRLGGFNGREAPFDSRAGDCTARWSAYAPSAISVPASMRACTPSGALQPARIARSVARSARDAELALRIVRRVAHDVRRATRRRRASRPRARPGRRRAPSFSQLKRNGMRGAMLPNGSIPPSPARSRRIRHP